MIERIERAGVDGRGNPYWGCTVCHWQRWARHAGAARAAHAVTGAMPCASIARSADRRRGHPLTWRPAFAGGRLGAVATVNGQPVNLPPFREFTFSGTYPTNLNQLFTYSLTPTGITRDGELLIVDGGIGEKR